MFLLPNNIIVYSKNYKFKIIIDCTIKFGFAIVHSDNDRLKSKFKVITSLKITVRRIIHNEPVKCGVSI